MLNSSSKQMTTRTKNNHHLSQQELDFLIQQQTQDQSSESSVEDLSLELQQLRQKVSDLETKRREEKKRFQESENRFWNFFYGNDAVKLLLDPKNGQITDSNQQAAAFYGYNSNELNQLHIQDLTPLPESVLQKELQKAKQQWSKPQLFLQRLSSGALQDVEVHAGPVDYQGRRLILCIVHDASHQLRAREAIRGSMEEQFLAPGKNGAGLLQMSDREEHEVLLDSIQTQIWYFQDPYTYGMVNQAHADFIGLEKYELQQAKIRDILEPAVAEKCIEDNQKVFRQKKQIKISRWCTNTNAQERLLHITKTPVLDQQGRVSFLVCSAQDITKYKLHQDALVGKLRLLKSRTLIDSLTRIPNRRYLDDFLRREWGRARREESYISLLIVDIDHFKAFNDNYGHLAGDNCLRQVARALTEVVTRSTDIVARYGGEEFAVVLSKTGYAGALQVAEKLRSQIEALKIPHAYSPVSDKLTVSIGGASILPLMGIKDISQQALLKNADQALYQAKDAGRDQVVCRELQFNVKS